jgi:hypothetical protein
MIQFGGLAQYKQMLGPVISPQGRLDGRLAGTHTPIYQGRQFSRLALPFEDGVDDGQPAGTRHVAEHLGQLHIHLQQGFLHVLALRAAGGNQFVAIAQIGAQDTIRVFGPERALQQTVGVQALDPLTVLHIAFAPGHILGLARIDQDNLQSAPFQNLKQGYPIDARGLHRDGGDAALFEPRGHGFQLGGEGAKLADVLRAGFAGHAGPMFPRTDVHASRMEVDGFPHRVQRDFLVLFFGFCCFAFHVVKGRFRPKSGRKNCNLLNRMVPPARQSRRNFTNASAESLGTKLLNGHKRTIGIPAIARRNRPGVRLHPPARHTP